MLNLSCNMQLASAKSFKLRVFVRRQSKFNLGAKFYSSQGGGEASARMAEDEGERAKNGGWIGILREGAASPFPAAKGSRGAL